MDLIKYQVLGWLIELFQRGWVPPDNLSEKEYKDNQESYPPYLVGFVRFGCSFGAKWFGGYARNSRRDNYCLQKIRQAPGLRNVCFESKNNILKQSNNIQGVVIENKNYLDLEIPDNIVTHLIRILLNILLNLTMKSFGIG